MLDYKTLGILALNVCFFCFFILWSTAPFMIIYLLLFQSAYQWLRRLQWGKDSELFRVPAGCDGLMYVLGGHQQDNEGTLQESTVWAFSDTVAGQYPLYQHSTRQPTECGRQHFSIKYGSIDNVHFEVVRKPLNSALPLSFTDHFGVFKGTCYSKCVQKIDILCD